MLNHFQQWKKENGAQFVTLWEKWIEKYPYRLSSRRTLIVGQVRVRVNTVSRNDEMMQAAGFLYCVVEPHRLVCNPDHVATDCGLQPRSAGQLALASLQDGRDISWQGVPFVSLHTRDPRPPHTRTSHPPPSLPAHGALPWLCLSEIDRWTAVQRANGLLHFYRVFRRKTSTHLCSPQRMEEAAAMRHSKLGENLGRMKPLKIKWENIKRAGVTDDCSATLISQESHCMTLV